MKRVPVLLVLLVAGLLAPLALASGFFPPGGAQSVVGGEVTLAYWIGPSPDVGEVAESVNTSEQGNLWFGVQKARWTPAQPDNATEGNATDENATDTNATLEAAQWTFVNLTSTDLVFDNANLVIRSHPLTSTEWDFTNSTFQLAAQNLTEAAYTFTVESYRTDANGTVLLGTATGGGTVRVSQPVIAPGLPVTYLVAGGAVVVVGAGAAIFAMRQRREQRLMNQAPRRSQVMREMELEREMEKVAEKDPEAAQEIRQELRVQEQVREKRRELQILEAKRADLQKGMDLLRKRHEAGGLTKHQYDTMVAKRQQDLQRIEAEIAEMEAQDAAGGGSAAA